MPDLSFEIVSAGPARDMITPAIVFELRVFNRPPEESIHAILLRCQIQIEAARRKYNPSEQVQIEELFDKPARWSDTLRPMTWANTSLNVPAFCGSTVCPLVVSCPLDFSIATTKYFRGIEAGDVPLTFLFSGSIFYASEHGTLQVYPVSWSKEARFRLPIETWKSLIEMHYPNAVSLSIRRDVFEELYRFKMNCGLASFDETIERALALAERSRSAQ